MVGSTLWSSFNNLRTVSRGGCGRNSSSVAVSVDLCCSPFSHHQSSGYEHHLSRLAHWFSHFPRYCRIKLFHIERLRRTYSTSFTLLWHRFLQDHQSFNRKWNEGRWIVLNLLVISRSRTCLEVLWTDGIRRLLGHWLFVSINILIYSLVNIFSFGCFL